MPEPPAHAFRAAAEAAPVRGFDRVAWCYDVLAGAVFGPAQRRAQLVALAGLPATAGPHVLILGGGTGWVLTEVLRRRPQATVLYLEASPNMLARARRRLASHCPAAAPQVEFRHGTQAALLPPESFDAVITFFVLDCIAAPELDAALNQLRQAQRPGAPWLVADFRPARRGWRHWLLVAMYAFFRLTTGLRARQLPDVRAELTQRGLRPAQEQRFFGQAIEAGIYVEQG
ncbi:class I SAM-dependent methyltransferase [Hymenobacter sp. 5317J-9]|uniref:class I SAM-dependent methyltransferase n=1 Tax=Hymenobacter sp. 5317J-9 TaxID=2932250 RepID=UPI001FD648E2|nr:class I SAM-dependent methyltransferase [Hymenobacter sp. 5317J-9]UOQ96352.1 class I SAM-dependent methyltransferase [Hymenobacter sp. 5317J-9]